MRSVTFSGKSSKPAENVYIGASAFYHVSVDEFTVPASVVYIGKDALQFYYSSAKIRFENGSKIAAISYNERIFEQTNYAKKYSGGYYIGSEENPYLVHIASDPGITKAVILPNTAVVMGFSGQSSITEGTVPDGVRGIGARAFKGCTSLKKLTVVSAVAISEEAFSGCENLSEVTIGEGLIYLADKAFYGCSMNAIALPTTLCIYGKDSMPHVLKIIRGGKIYKYDEWGELTKDNIWIFENNDNYRIPIYADVTDFTYSFDGYQVTFHGCASFEGGVFTVPSELYGSPITVVYAIARKDNYKVTDVKLPDNVTYLGNQALMGCTLSSVFVIPETVTHIGIDVFRDCVVDEIVLPSNIKVLGNQINYSNIKRVNLTKNVTRIEHFALEGSSKLEYVILGTQVTYIGGSAFSPGYPIVDVFYEGTEYDFDLNVLLSGRDSLTGTVLYFYSETPPTESGNFWHYVNGLPVKW